MKTSNSNVFFIDAEFNLRAYFFSNLWNSGLNIYEEITGKAFVFSETQGSSIEQRYLAIL